MVKRCPDPRREGKSHNWVLGGIRTKGVHGGSTLLAPLYRWCNFCTVEDHETKLCEATVMVGGRWPSWHTCGALAHVESHIHPETQKQEDTIHNYCKRHDPVAVAKRREDAAAKEEAKYDAETYGLRWGWNGGKTIPVLQQFSKWAEANEDLVEADEWLGTIVRNLREINLG